MEEAGYVKDILEELTLDCLKEASQLKGIEIDSRSREVYIDELSAQEWSEGEIRELIRILVKCREKTVRALMTFIFESSELINQSEDDIIRYFRIYGVDFDKENIFGFRILGSTQDSKGDKLLKFEYWFTRKVLILDDTERLRVFKVPSKIEFEIDKLRGFIYIYTNNPGLALKCKKGIEKTLNIILNAVSPIQQEEGDAGVR